MVGKLSYLVEKVLTLRPCTQSGLFQTHLTVSLLGCHRVNEWILLRGLHSICHPINIKLIDLMQNSIVFYHNYPVRKTVFSERLLQFGIVKMACNSTLKTSLISYILAPFSTNYLRPTRTASTTDTLIDNYL